MTGKEKQKAIDALKISVPIKALTQEEFNDYIQTLNKVMDWLEQEPKWIPVSERFPKLDVDVLVTDIHGNRFVHTLQHDSKDGTFYWEDDAGFFVDFNDVTAWMPLPAPYEPQEVEDQE